MSSELKEVHNCHHLGMTMPLTSKREEEFPLTVIARLTTIQSYDDKSQ